jgi:hypothetical protein
LKNCKNLLVIPERLQQNDPRFWNKRFGVCFGFRVKTSRRFHSVERENGILWSLKLWRAVTEVKGRDSSSEGKCLEVSVRKPMRGVDAEAHLQVCRGRPRWEKGQESIGLSERLTVFRVDTDSAMAYTLGA